MIVLSSLSRAKYKGKTVAAKIYQLATNVDEFKREVKILVKAGGHPNVMQVIEFFETPKPCLLMELIEGGSMSDYLKKNQNLSFSKVLSIAEGLASGIAHLHSAGFVHRDLKSLNVLMRGDVPVIIDLGLGTEFDKNSNSTAHMVNASGVKGTILWMAPEMLEAAFGGAPPRFSDKVKTVLFLVFRFPRSKFILMMLVCLDGCVRVWYYAVGARHEQDALLRHRGHPALYWQWRHLHPCIHSITVLMR